MQASVISFHCPRTIGEIVLEIADVDGPAFLGDQRALTVELSQNPLPLVRIPALPNELPVPMRLRILVIARVAIQFSGFRGEPHFAIVYKRLD